MFYLPLAFFVPPRLFYFHQQVNLIYQFWIHTKLVGKTPLLDLVLNTPSLHRVHHGRNPLYLDKNYGGILIIWDRIFGTFQAETEEPAFGLVHPSQSFNLFRGQLAHLQYMCGRIIEEKGVWNKWAVIWKGPGWREGAPRLGFASDIPDLDPTYRKYDPALSASLNYYIALNFFAVSLLSVFFTFNMIPLTPGHLIFLALFVLGLQSFSVMFDKEFYACYMELARTSAFVVCDLYCYLTSGSEGHKYLFLWYEDPTGYFSSTSLGFVLLRIIWVGSFLFMLFHIMSGTGMLIPREKKVDKLQALDPASELLKGSRPSGLSSPKPLSPAANGSPSSRTHSRKPRSLQVGVALLETL
jgi:alkylglycerol monooxygenase